jgi:Peptidase family M23
MRQPHTLRRTLLAVVAALLLGPLAAAPASAGPVVKPIVFPVDGPVTYTDTFGAPRSGHTHEGQDLMGRKMLPLLAAVDGVVHRIKFNNATGNSLVIRAADGWTYHYIHVNNDRPGTDDGQATRAQAFPDRIVLGAQVRRGEVVGFLGDSGNAESAGAHLHFEIRQPPAPGTYTGAPINPYESLRQAVGASTTPGWELRWATTAGAADHRFSYGSQPGDRALLCDWNGDGADDPVIYRSGTWHLRGGVQTAGTASQVAFGTSTDTPLCGDVDGDGTDEPVLFRAGTWTVRDGFGAADPVAFTVRYGVVTGDQPVFGDWDGDHDDDLGIHRSGHWHLRSTGTPAGVSVTTFPYGAQPGDKPVSGDWDGDGDDDPAIFRVGQWHLRSNAQPGGVTATSFRFGASSGQPVTGHGDEPLAQGVGTFLPVTA